MMRGRKQEHRMEARLFERQENDVQYWLRSEAARARVAKNAATADPRVEFEQLCADIKALRPHWSDLEISNTVRHSERGAALLNEINDRTEVLDAVEGKKLSPELSQALNGVSKQMERVPIRK